MNNVTRPYRLLLAALAASASLAPCARAQMHVDGAPAAALDWRDVAGGSARVLYFGDVHSSVAIKRVLAGAMLDFARAGAGVLAVQMLRASDQPLLDRYGLDPAARRRVGERIGKSWQAPAEEYLKLLDAAHAAGLSLYALTPDPAPGGDDDARMAAALAALSRRPGGGKVVVFGGVDAAKRAAQPSRLLEDGTASRTYAFAESGDGAAKKLYTAGLEDGLWLLPGGADFDGLISAPAVLKEAAR